MYYAHSTGTADRSDWQLLWTAIFDRLPCEPQAMAALSGSSIDGKQAVRSVFNAAECVFKLMNPRSTKLTSAEAVRLLQATSQVIYASNPTAQRAANKMIHSFADWADVATIIVTRKGWRSRRNPRLISRSS